jgi:Ser/Thr protein kinase RdoA (MazF antagonist)
MKDPHEIIDQLIADSLSRLDIHATVSGYDILAGGISGSHTCRLHLETGPVVLKVTLANSEPYILHRARRELQFYQALADRIPLQVPRVLASAMDDTFGVCILLAAYQPAAPSHVWDERDYFPVVAQLARFHALYWGRADELAAFPWLKRPAPEADEAQVRRAREVWRELLAQEQFADLAAEDPLRAIDAALTCLPEIDAARRAFPLTLCHGDCHLGNLLRDARGGLVWADWQEVGIGRGTEDLSFLLQRAYPQGNDVLAERLARVYAAHLATEIGHPVPLAAICRVMDAFELRARLLEWPFYLGSAPVEVISGMLSQIEVLVDRIID